MVMGVTRRRTQADPAVFRITSARQSLDDDVRGRQRRYVISMLVRTAAVLLTVLLWDVSRPLAVVALVLGAVLPYVAVVIANAGRENAPKLPSTFLTSTSGRELPPSEWNSEDDDHKRS
jgi:hypothetical protein